MPHATIDRRVEQALKKVNASPFERCPERTCDYGFIEHLERDRITGKLFRWYEVCSACGGSGYVLIEAPAPDFVVRFRDWCNTKARAWLKKYGWRIGWAIGVFLLLVVLAADLWLGWAL